MDGYEVCRADPRRPRAPRSCRSSWSPRAASRRGCARSRRAPTTSSPSRSTRPSCSPGCARCCGSSATTTRSSAQAAELAGWNRELEAAGRPSRSSELERLGRLRRFLSPQVAELVVDSGDESFLESHRREITVGVLRPARLHRVRRDRRAGGGDGGARASTTPRSASWSTAYEGTLEHFAGDGLMVFFNDPLPCPDAPERAVRMAVAMRDRVAELAEGWRRHGLRPRLRRRHRPGLRHARAGSASRAATTTPRSAASPTSPPGCAPRPRPARSWSAQRVHAGDRGRVVTADAVGRAGAARLPPAGRGLRRHRPRRGRERMTSMTADVADRPPRPRASSTRTARNARVRPPAGSGCRRSGAHAAQRARRVGRRRPVDDLDRRRGAAGGDEPGARGALPVPAAAAAPAAAADGLRDVDADRPAAIVEYYLGAAARRHPEPRPRAPVPGLGRTTRRRAADREAAGAAAAARPRSAR